MVEGAAMLTEAILSRRRWFEAVAVDRERIGFSGEVPTSPSPRNLGPIPIAVKQSRESRMISRTLDGISSLI
jgi:hypothetical protein